MKIIQCDHSWKEIWNQFVTANSTDAGFLQSWQWGEFQSQLGRGVFRLLAQDNNGEILAAAQIIRMPLPLGKSYLYIPRGPVIKTGLLSSRANPPQADERGDLVSPKLLSRPELTEVKHKIASVASLPRNDIIIEFLFSEIKSLAQKEKAIFVRFDPAWPVEMLRATPLLQKVISVGQVQPQQTLILNLGRSADELAAQMKSKTRYNIKVAQKHCVKIDEGEQYLDDFIALTKKTAQRDEFVSHSDNYYRQMFATLSPAGLMKLIVAKYDTKVVVANLVVFFGDWCVYLHGASDYDYRDKMAPYLLQWEAIQSAQAQGKKFYDFWGVDEKKWPGVTRFKVGFSPEEKFTEYAGAFDLVISGMWYKIYKIFKK